MNKSIIAVIVLLILIIAGGYFAVKKYSAPKSPEQPAENPNPPIDPKEAEYRKYLLEGMNYRAAGLKGDKSAFYKAIDSYKKAAELGEEKVWIPYLNLGNTYVLVQDYKNAEESYNKALEISPGEPTVYLQKIDLYRTYMKKSDKDINALYGEALKRVVDNANLVIGYAAFLRETQKYSEALKYYKILAEKYPADQRFKDEIAELEKKLK